MPSNRLSGIDITRGLVMVLMALDHARDFFGDHSIDALDVAHTSVPLFAARWLTHLCAPTFVFLAGISVALARSKQPGLPLSQLALCGLWLVVLEQTFLRCFGWYFNFDYRFMNAGILWGTGWAMVLLAGVLALCLPSNASRVPPVWTCRVAVSGTRDLLVGNLAWPSTGLWPRPGLGCRNLVACDRAPMADLPVVRPL
jgi:uncharacterized membrane protein